MHISSSYAKILGIKLFRTWEIPRSGSKAEDREKKRNTPGTAGGPGGCDRTLAVKSRKTSEKSPFFLKKIKFTPEKYFFLRIYVLVMRKYWVKNYFAHGSFPEVGKKQKPEEKEEREKD